jgi:glycolate oxidase FAD binding subunit
MPVVARPATSAESVVGVLPGAVYEPATVDEAVEAVRESAHGGKSLLFVGGGTELDLGSPPERLDAALRTTNLNRIVEYEPSDQIVVVEAGLTLEVLQETLAPHRQRLALDPPRPGRATLGGIVASNAFGPRRARFGSVRDLILGVSLVRADGVLARSGGKVVKNVAGFDLPKLLVGSLGTLGLIATATFRLHPLPEESATLLILRQSARQVRDLVAAIRQAQLEPTSVVAFWRRPSAFDVAVRFEGFRAGVEEQASQLLALSGIARSGELLSPSAATSLWEEHDALRTAAPLRAKLAALPASIEEVADSAVPPLLDALESPALLWYATLGIGFVSGIPSPPERAAEAVVEVRRRLGSGGTLVLLAAPAAVRELAGVWGALPPSLSLMRGVKSRLDPQRRLSPGRFVGGI